MLFSKKATTLLFLLYQQPNAVNSFITPSPQSKKTTTSLYGVSVGLGPKAPKDGEEDRPKDEEEDRSTWSQEKRDWYEKHALALANTFSEEDRKKGEYYQRWQDTSIPYMERNFDPYRKQWYTELDKECDDWFTGLLGDGGKDWLPLGDISKGVYELLHTPVPLKFDPKHPKTHPEYTRYYRRNQPNEILWPANGCEHYGMPIPRRTAEAWRHFDTMGMIGTDYTLNPKDRGTELILDEEQTSKIQSTLKEKGAWLDDTNCTARLIYINGRFCPTLSKTVPSVAYNLSPSDFPLSDPEITKCLDFLPDGFTDEIPTEEGLKPDMKELAGSDVFSKLSFPDHQTGPYYDLFAINHQTGLGTFGALNSMKTGAVALINVPEEEAPEGFTPEIAWKPEGKPDDDEEVVFEEVPPMLVVNAWTADGGNDEDTDKGISCHPRTLLIAGKHSRVDLVQFVVDLEEENTRPKMHNGLTTCFVRTGAKVSHSYLEETGGYPTPDVELWEDPKPRIMESQRPATKNTHFESIDVISTGPKSTYKGTVMQFGGNGRSRIAFRSCLCRPGAKAELNGFTCANGAQSADFRATVVHVSPDTTAKQLHKIVLGGRAEATYKGRIRMDHHAQKSDSEQLCRTLLLTDEAKILAIPALEIVPDQVKCSHGATVCDVSDEERFYMQSRGFSPSLARNLLMFGFASDLFPLVSQSVQFGGKSDKGSFANRMFKRLNNMVTKVDRKILGQFMNI